MQLLARKDQGAVGIGISGTPGGRRKKIATARIATERGKLAQAQDNTKSISGRALLEG